MSPSRRRTRQRSLFTGSSGISCSRYDAAEGMDKRSTMPELPARSWLKSYNTHRYSGSRALDRRVLSSCSYNKV